MGAAAARLAAQIEALRARRPAPARLADAEVFLKGVRWALDYEQRLAPADTALIWRALQIGSERADALAAGRAPWAGSAGRSVRGFVSAIDGSVQPYGVIVPSSYDPSQPARLDVVLHGSTRPTGMSELRFMLPFEGGDPGPAPAAAANWIELRPLGRVENCYRWAGETDVFEAIADVRRSYRVDPDRIVLRGMSMEASGTWHLGLKHPDRFVALGPYCGYVDTHEFSRSPVDNFVRLGPLPPHQEQALHMLDSVDYAANAGMVPVVAAMGEKDPFFQAHVLMGRAMEREGLHLLNLISPGTAHVQDPATFAEQLRRIAAIADRGANRQPDEVRFVTWTLKYPRCRWVEILGLKQHYARAEMRAQRKPDGAVRVEESENVTRFSLRLQQATTGARRLTVGDKTVALPRGAREPVIGRRGAGWAYVGERQQVKMDGKRPGLQGPIDDAFTTPFLCVRGTGKPWNEAPGAWAAANLQRFSREWRRYFRGDLPVKDDTAVTPADVRRCNLVLFGDPGSNHWIAEALADLPLTWSRTELRLKGERYPAANHAPVLIAPNPLPGGSGRYVVLNSGHTFHEQELASLNYLLFPRLGDWTIVKLEPQREAGPTGRPAEEVVRAGFFDEGWR